MRRFLLQFVCVLSLLGSASSEPIYLRNRLFKGPQQGTGKNLLIGMQAFANQMELKVTQQDDTYFIHPKAVTGTDFGVSDPGAVYVVGRKVNSQTLPDGTILISLWQSAESAGFRVVPNASLGTVDVSMAPVPKIDLPLEVASTPDAGQDDASNEVAGSASPAHKSVKRGTIPGRESNMGLTVLKPVPPRYINQSGAAVDCSQAVTPGRYNLVVFGASW